MLGYKLMAFVGLRNAEGPNAVRIMDMEKYYGLWMEVHVFRLNFGLLAPSPVVYFVSLLLHTLAKVCLLLNLVALNVRHLYFAACSNRAPQSLVSDFFRSIKERSPFCYLCP